MQYHQIFIYLVLFITTSDLVGSADSFAKIGTKMQSLHATISRFIGSEPPTDFDKFKAEITPLFTATDKKKKPKAEEIIQDTFKALLYGVGSASANMSILRQTAHSAVFGIPVRLGGESQRSSSELEQVLKQAQAILVAYSADLSQLLKTISLLPPQKQAQLPTAVIQSFDRQANCLFELLKNYKAE